MAGMRRGMMKPRKGMRPGKMPMGKKMSPKGSHRMPDGTMMKNSRMKY